MVANISPTDPPSPALGVKRLNYKFSEHDHAALKENRKCSNMVANADRGTIKKKYIKADFWSKACAPKGLGPMPSN